MKAQLMPEATLTLKRKLALREKLDAFYGSVTDYTAFSTVSNQELSWLHIEKDIHKWLKMFKNEKVHVLEVGAGKSGFGSWLKERGIRHRVYWCAQDITTQNADWLDSQADQTIYQDVMSLKKTKCYDIIFSTYVLEHVTDPNQHLKILYDLLATNGSLFIFCPRYDIPGYFCPSSRHLSLQARIRFGLQWSLARCSSLLSKQPAFLIQTDLAAFYGPFFRDSDAVHWVSSLDLKLWGRSKGAKVKQLRIVSPWGGVKDWFVKRWLTCAIEFRKHNAIILINLMILFCNEVQ